ncbi:MAG: hypothetical protein JW770_02405 [Actinobacteria bacterium]|nr:hypothetical protein [Actinomycetota bacterium]
MRKKNKKYNIPVNIFTTIVLLFFTVLSGSCTTGSMIKEVFTMDDDSLVPRYLDIDEREVKSIKVQEQEMEKSYDISKDISSIADELENPYEPFFETGEEEPEKNIIIVEQIYSKDGTPYAEIKFNDFVYLLTEDDVFLDVYSVRAINETSVVLLKGDDVISLFMGEPFYD